MNHDPVGQLGRREWLLAALAVLSGCGGVDSGGTGNSATFAVGTITGFGSVIVNGVHYDDTQALVVDDDDSPRARDELRLGMQAEVLASAITVQAGVPSATATAIRVRSELRGPITSLDTAARRLVVLGQRVDAAATTVTEGGFDALAVGQVVEVFATLDLARQRYVATRIERRAGATTYKVRGAIRALDLGASTLDVGDLRISWTAAAPADPALTLAPGRFVRVTLAPAPTAGVWQALRLDADVPVLEDRDAAEVEGRITAFVSVTSFAVNGIPVDARGAAFPDGTAGLVLGAKVEVGGRLEGGSLVASRVELEADDDDAEGFELDGSIESIDAAAQQFVVRGVTVVWTANTLFEGGVATDLRVGRRVEVRGRLAGDGVRIEATRIHVEG